MDCVIPAHNVKIFSNAIASLCKVGKELLIEFSVKEGLTLRALNDAKSAFSSFQFKPSFFERCQGTTGGHSNGNNKRRRRSDEDDRYNGDNEDEDKYMCRVLLKTVASVLKPRRGVDSLRLRSSDEQRQVGGRGDSSPTSTAVSEIIHEEKNAIHLIFEFHCEPGGMRISHRIGIADLETSISAVAPRDNCSEIVAAPKALMKMIDPLKQTLEVSLHVNNQRKVSLF